MLPERVKFFDFGKLGRKLCYLYMLRSRLVVLFAGHDPTKHPDFFLDLMSNKIVI